MTQENQNKEILEKRITELEAEVRELEKDLIHDALTGLKTRAFLEEELEVYLATIAQNEKGKRKEWFGFKNVSVVFFDIDHFKKINDTYGHDIGDIALRTVAETIQASLRTGDTAARWGGEEMIASLLGAGEKDAVEKAEEIRQKIEKLDFAEATNLKMTISSGVASSDGKTSLEELVKRADQALYQAKNSGRNKVVAYSEISKESGNL